MGRLFIWGGDCSLLRPLSLYTATKSTLFLNPEAPECGPSRVGWVTLLLVIRNNRKKNNSPALEG